MAFVNALDASTPADTDFAKFGALEIRTKTAATRERLSSFFTNIDTDPLEAKDGALLGNVNSKTILPRTDNTYALGSASFRYVNIFSVTGTFTTVAVNGTITSNSTITAATSLNSNGTLNVAGNTALSGTLLVSLATTLATTLSVIGNLTVNTNRLIVNATTGDMTVFGILTAGNFTTTGVFNASAGGSFGSLTVAGDITMGSGRVNLFAATSGTASLRFGSGSAPTSPVNGDMWFDGSALKIVILGVTKTFTVT